MCLQMYGRMNTEYEKSIVYFSNPLWLMTSSKGKCTGIK